MITCISCDSPNVEVIESYQLGIDDLDVLKCHDCGEVFEENE